MSVVSSNLPAPAVPVAQLLGLRDGADAAVAGRVRATQLHAARRMAPWLLVANLACVAMVVALFHAAAPLAMVAGWGAVGAILVSAVAARRLVSHHRDEGYATARDLRDTVTEGLALAAVWGSAPVLFAGQGGPVEAIGLWLAIILAMVAVAVGLAALAIAAEACLAAVGLAAIATLVMAGGWIPAIAMAMLTAVLMAGALSRGAAKVQLRANELALAERDETVSLLLREFEDTSADWLWETDAARRVVRASPRFAYALGLDPVTIDGMPFLQVLAGPTWEAGNFSAGLRLLADKLKTRESFRDIALPVSVAGEERWWEISASPRLDENGTFIGFRGVGSDVTEQRASADKINRMARFDTLTGLPNRLLINETLARAMAEADKWGTRCAFMMIDLDRFKAVNDTLGHPIGDRLLGRVSERLSRLVTETEIIGRLGGDEFAVVVRDATDSTRVEKLARTIIETLSKPYEVDQHTLYIGASVGVATSPRDGRTAEMLIRSADLALYRSKDAGGGVFHAYEPQLHTQAEERRVLEMALRGALDNGELYLDYQPVVDTVTSQLVGFEALIRWKHPELGQISPFKFISLAEDARLIEPIGAWVVRTACEEAARWPEGVRVAVNVSPEQLLNPGFVAVVASALANSGLDTSRLELEVTESVFMKEGTSAVKTLERLLDLGIRLSLDDFGTGYSSLGYLSRTRFSTIKIDRSFVRDAAKGEREAIAICRAVVALADSLGMATTAEGVETETELAMVQGLGCTKIQGYYYGRPLPVAEARQLACRRWDDAAAA